MLNLCQRPGLMNKQGSCLHAIGQNHRIHDLAAKQTAQTFKMDLSRIVPDVIKSLDDHEAFTSSALHVAPPSIFRDAYLNFKDKMTFPYF